MVNHGRGFLGDAGAELLPLYGADEQLCLARLAHMVVPGAMHGILTKTELRADRLLTSATGQEQLGEDSKFMS
jgi:hypothetical protein